MKIWIVTGECGEYSDWTCWTACAFDTEEKAQAFEKECNDFEKKLNEKYDRFDYSSLEKARQSHPDKYASKYHSSNCTYKVSELELR